jgi:hypothetical protein
MARSPFQGNFQPNSRPTVVTAPDALVYINGELDIIGCSSCKRRFDLSKYVTSIQTNLDIDSVPGSATISLSIPRHTIDDFMVDGVPIISPMMEVEIFAKGYYLLEGVPQYYPIFWGLVNEVSDSYSGGEHTVSISCSDILKWWEICKMNVNAAYTAPQTQLGSNGVFRNVLFGTNPYDLIYTLAQMAFGDVILATGSLRSLYKETGQKSTFTESLGDIMRYWSERFGRIRSNLLLYGVNGTAVRGDTLPVSHEDGGPQTSKGFVSATVRRANGGDSNRQMVFDPTDPAVTAFRTQLGQAGEINLWQSEYQTKLEIANACKEAIGFEFYMDVDGSIVFKPPFYNLDVLSNKPVSWIQDIDIIDWDFSHSDSEVVTQLTLQGSWGGNIDYGMPAELTPFTSVTDYHLLRKFGWRPQTYNSEFMGDTLRMFYHGLDVIDRFNSRQHQATINIPLRPELRLGFPIYIAPKDQIWYIKGISHNIQFGGRATTTLSLTARREKHKAIRGIATLKGNVPRKATTRQVAKASYSLELGDAATIPPINVDREKPESLRPYEPLILRHPKTGRIVGYPNVVMVYTRPYDPGPAHENISGRSKTKTKVKQVSPEEAARLQKKAEEVLNLAKTDASTSLLQHKYSGNRFSYGLNSAGVYVYAYDKTQAIKQFTLIPERNMTVTEDGKRVDITSENVDRVKNPSSMVRPVSDERGFEVIGHYQYGRGVSLRDGSLILNETGPNSRTGQENVGDLQLALSGSLVASLNAQASGLTTTSQYVNPADAVARLQPDDLQTAAVTVPNQDEIRFSNTGTSFVDSAPLGSPEQKGLPSSVEASQLSRALTLAEMTVKFDKIPGVDSCECLRGRADLSFINFGYQVDTLRSSEPAAEEESLAGSLTLQQLEGEGKGVTLKNPDLKGQDIVSRVESYLFNLYRALDESHSAHEETLRGTPSGPAPKIFPDQEEILDPSFVGFEPPFSSPNRASLGDPKATAQQGLTSRKDLVRNFKSFGDDLRKNAKASKLTGEISSLKAKDARLRKRLAEVGDPNGATIIGNTDDRQELERQLAEVDRQLAQKEGELALLTSPKQQEEGGLAGLTIA